MSGATFAEVPVLMGGGIWKLLEQVLREFEGPGLGSEGAGVRLIKGGYD